jgi:hypothetical protein
MTLTVKALESIQTGDKVTLSFADSRQIYCRKASESEAPDAIARHDIEKDESIAFDSGRNTEDLARPHAIDYKREL